MPDATFTKATRRFLAAAEWLTDEDEPAKTTLVLVARQLDEGGINPPLLAQYGLTYRHLLKSRPKDSGESSDPLAALLDEE